MAETKMDTFVVVKPATVKSIYDTKMKKKVIMQLGKSANAAFGKAKGISLKKPKDWDKNKNKGVIVNTSLEELSKKEVKSEVHFTAKIKVTLFPMKGQAIGKVPVGSGTVKNSATMKKLDDEAVFIAGHVLTTLIKKDVTPVIKSL